jgi:simple sugar transport system permease protein
MGKLMIAGWSDWSAFLVAICCGVLIGLFNGLITTTFNIPSLITTLAALYILRGISYDITDGQTVLQFSDSPLFRLFGDTIGDSFVTAVLVWAVVLTAVLWMVLQHTRYGNWVFAAGDKTKASRAMGVPTRRVKTTNFVISAVLAAFAGCLQFAAFGGASPANGAGYELLAIVACVIGGTSLFGVKGTVIGAFLGAITIAVLQTGLVLIGAPGNSYQALIGIILIVAVILNETIAGSHGVSHRWRHRIQAWTASRDRD